VTYGAGVDERELCNMRYVTLLRERIEAALRPGEGRTGKLIPVLDEYQSIGSTDHIVFTTAKPCDPTLKSHLSHAVCDSMLELGIVRQLEQDSRVVAYAKNDHLFLEVPYRFLGRNFRYRPDYIVRLESDVMLLLEAKGKADEKDDAKATAARRWKDAVNAWGRLGRWEHGICYKKSEVSSVLDQALLV
jgi:type III restriction enzyme